MLYFSLIPNRVIPLLFTLCFSFITNRVIALLFKEKRNNPAWYKTKTQHKEKRNHIGIKLKHSIKRSGITMFGIKLSTT
jgi:uncharacterized membrane-anchored protein YitT (DUF2179 family)